MQLSASAQVLIAGQAPGRRVHETGVPFDDPSGDRLREWMGVTRETFYDPRRIAILPMGLCYPGTGRSGDLPPRPECAPAWREALLDKLKKVELTLVLGRYAQSYHVPGAPARSPKSCGRGATTGPRCCPYPTPARATASGCGTTPGSRRK